MRRIRQHLVLIGVTALLLSVGITTVRLARRSQENKRIWALVTSEARDEKICREMVTEFETELEKLESRTSPRTELLLRHLSDDTVGDRAAAMRLHRDELRAMLREQIAVYARKAQTHAALRLEYENTLSNHSGRTKPANP